MTHFYSALVALTKYMTVMEFHSAWKVVTLTK